MICPRCSHDGPDADACSRCGVVFARLKTDRPRPTRPGASTEATSGTSHAGMVWLVVAVIAIGGAAAIHQSRKPRGTREFAAAAPPLAESAAEVIEDGPPPSLAPLALPAIDMPVAAGPAGDPDQDRARALVTRVNARQALSEADALLAQELAAKRPDDAGLRDLHEAVLLALAMQEQNVKRTSAALALLQRAAAAQPSSPRAHKIMLTILLSAGDWARAESAAREALGRQPRDPEALRSLAYCLMRQDRNREALETLKLALDVSDDSETRTMIAKLESDMANERGMTEQALAHFHVRYDGGDHADVGREITRALERHYSTLVRALDHQPQAAVTVILFTQEGYYNASGAPAWSGGAYDLTDGKIRIPIGGLTTSLTDDMDETLIHELTHAFAWDISRGTAPRDIQEGLAQFMEGKRVDRYGPEYLKALADGRLGGVGGFYLNALSFMEYLQALRGQGGVNDLLKAMAQGSVDDAFRSVYGKTQTGMQRDWQERMRQQHGS